MDTLRMESLREGLDGPGEEIRQFHRTFLDEIRKRGRISEISLILRYRLRTGGIFSLRQFREDIGVGLRMLLQGKLKPPGSAIKDRGQVEEIFRGVVTKERTE
jgi:hypothetical protein